jgi:hypothetical protein
VGKVCKICREADEECWEAETCIANWEALDPLAISLEETSEKGNDSDDSQSHLNKHFEY